MSVLPRLTSEQYHSQKPAEAAPRRSLTRAAPWLLLILPLAVLLALAASPVHGVALEVTHLFAPRLGRLPVGGNAVAAVTWSNFTPTSWITVLPATSSVTAEAANGLDPATAGYAVSTDTGATWTAWSAAGLTVTGAVSTTQVLTVNGLNLPDANHANLLRFRIQEFGGALEDSPDYGAPVDTTAPSSAISQPTNGIPINTAPAIRGTATDGSGSGVAEVRVSLRNTATGLYWDGVAWVSGEQWLAAAGNTSWSYTGAPPAWADSVTYALRSRATDVAGKIETPGAEVRFTFDTTPPTVAVLSPNGGEVWAGGQPQTITWSAADTTGLAAAPITLSVSYDAGTTWQTIHAGQANSGSFSWTPPAVNNNQVLVQVEAVDLAGNRSSDRSNAVFTLDSAAPAAPTGLTANPPGWTKASSFFISWTNPADVSPVAGAWYKLDAPPAAANDGVYVAGANITTLAGISPATEGVHALYVWLQDTLGRANQANAATTTLFLDRTSPAPPFNLNGSPARTWTNVNNFAESWTNPADLSGIVGAYYKLDAAGTSETDGILVNNANSIAGIVAPSDGKHDLYLWLVDAAGNVSHFNRNIDPQVFWYDGTPPSSSMTLTPPLPANGWYSTTVTASFTGQDPTGGSGLQAVSHRLDTGAWNTDPTAQIATEGQHTLSYYAQDVAGNFEAVKLVSFALDLTPPAVTLTPDRLPQASGWYTAAVTLNLNVTDNLSGSPQGYYRINGGAWQTGKLITLPGDGVFLIEYYGQDGARNRSATASLQVGVDTAPPVTAYQVQGAQGQNGWYTSPLTVKLVPSDAVSGIKATYYRLNTGAWQTGSQFQVTGDGYYTLAFYSIDAAGNVETSFPVQVQIDSAAPGAPTAVESAPSGWSRTNRFTVQWANPTDLSGIAGVYYRLDGEPTGSTDGTYSPLTNRLEGLTVPTEGVHRLSLWLRDNAGNAEHRNRTLAPPLRYDATPPTTTAAIQGLAGDNGWYRGPVTVTLTTTDGTSGLAALHYRVDAGAWITVTTPTVSLTFTTADKHVLEYAGEDVAGNVEPMHTQTIRIDATPPPAPIALRAEPSGWQRYNSFSLTWTAPLDQSGIAGAYIKFDAPPTGPHDGTFFTATETLQGIQVPAEGQYAVYVWLRDQAGNSDQSTAVALPDAMWYDGTPPQTAVTQTGKPGQSGWYMGPVEFAMSAGDATSGLADIAYQIDDGAWESNSGFTLAAEGSHIVRIASRDVAGNVEPAQMFYVNIDSRPPVAKFAMLSRYQSAPSFTVTWQGADPQPGSGLTTYDIQVRDGYQASWQNWLTRTTQTSATYTGVRGHTYFFRVAARDLAGNQQSWTAGDTYGTVETVLNGGFTTGNFSEWTASGILFKAVVPTTGRLGTEILAARLGSPDYGPSLTDPGSVPVGDATITQTIRVPDLSQVARPTLTFWYRVMTYDVKYSQNFKRDQDTLDVWLYTQAGKPLKRLMRDGNPTTHYGELYDTGWELGMSDLTSYAGQTVQLVFANYNRWDNLFNTWSFIADVRVADMPTFYHSRLPVITSRTTGQAAAAEATSIEPPAEVPTPEPIDGKR